MKNFITKYCAYVILAAMVIMLIPGIGNRLENENKNNNVTISVLYNDLFNKLPQSEVIPTLEEYKKAGIDTVSVMADDLNSLVSRGDLTCIKYNVLCHKYDKESVDIADLIAENCPNLSNDSYVVLVRKENIRERLAYSIPRKYTQDEYAYIGEIYDLDIYIMYDGRKDLWNYSFGYDEDLIKDLTSRGFKVALIHSVKNYSTFEYLEDIDRLVKEYDIKYLNLKETTEKIDENAINYKNYTGLSEIINNNDMTLVVTENVNQLSNQQFLGYSDVLGEVTKDGGSQKLIRSYETYDDTQAEGTDYGYRVEQYFNSTIDRNIRFITVTQLAPDKIPYEICAENTLKATVEYKTKIEELGFRVNGDTQKIDYRANKPLNAAICAVIMIMCLLLMLNMAFGKQSLILTVSALVLSALAFAATFVLPASLLSLYPTAFSVIQSCFAMTAVLYFIKTCKDKFALPLLLIGAVAIMLFALLIGSVAMGVMLSGINYYINSEIFRGIKLSLIIPVFYTAVLYYFMFIKNTNTGIAKDIKKALNSQIKVYWVLLAGAVLIVGIYYIIRSGNVNEISSFEQLMRSTITEHLPARPRTKEFLIGYPALILFVYYMKRSDIQIIKWLLAVAASILAASITNSFCHVFTDFEVILTRTANGLMLGVVVSVAAYIANLILIKICRLLKDRFN